ncbi:MULTISPECIES: DUF485 domain-containing protein [Paenibacillus]|uniref:DUF485 domain-containing protein n=1 Tax=Paenibacillus campinasensis TaxID=66347 RepID=A0A268EW57_9BACL|nr:MULTISPECIES: DUF485 domain-containing protein [Paenibacillus]MUG68477.1 DUF485 domain-containing protein [Paenibacillus campinasensis]PAD77345.1 hypothetical protein CHH67_10105 [Paenibacillus campinasensis]PAK50313.1 hypothetical protein CHH75_18345 [Paenibacillus sp. 7541]
METKGKSYMEVWHSDKFKKLLTHKKRFIVPMTVFFMLFYFALPILTSYTDILNHPAVGPITWAWVFAFAQFIMTWVLCILYTRKASQFDRIADDIKQEMEA